ncbi:restriction endonuclease subunit S [Clostridium sp.]|uniref:restriction endonuclease subunit S n=1 Tax=Clostridium sp. TaxID=1506 RepID=UPI0026215F47|nr:restriction endonuclease subunit S [Clostridium sp.]
MKKTPKLRFPEFSGDWKVEKSKNIFDKVKNGVDVKGNEKYRQIGIRSHGKGLFYKDEVTGKELGNKRVFWIEPNVFIVNIVFAWERAVARTTENEIGMIASHRFPMYKPKEGILDLDYITYFFKTSKGQSLLELASPGGAGRNKTLGQKEFDDLNIILPKIDEQKKIAEFLSILDKRIEKQQEKVEALQEYKNGIMSKIFSQEIRFKDENGQYYAEWKDKTVDEIVHIFLGLTYTPTYVEEGIPFLSVKDLKNNKINFADTKFISKEEFANATSNAKPKKGDILFGRVGTLGNPIIIDFDNEFCIFVSLGFLRVKSECVLNSFIVQWMKSSLFAKQVEEKIAGSSQKNLNTGWLKKFSINIPSFEEQEKIASILSKIDSKIEREQEKLKCLNQLKRGLIQQMFV